MFSPDEISIPVPNSEDLVVKKFVYGVNKGSLQDIFEAITAFLNEKRYDELQSLIDIWLDTHGLIEDLISPYIEY